MAPRSRRRRSRLLLRWLAAGLLALVLGLYYRPLRSYVETRDALRERVAEVEALRARKRALQRRLAVETSKDALLREARLLGYVKPGERLFIVKGIPEWRRARARARLEEDG